MPGLVADTHAVVWYLLDSPRLSAPAKTRMREAEENGEHIVVPSICLVELVYLVEKQRVAVDAWALLESALSSVESGYRVQPLDHKIAATVARVPRAQIPELPDRIIAATALHLDLPLVTRDLKIQASSIETIW